MKLGLKHAKKEEVKEPLDFTEFDKKTEEFEKVLLTNYKKELDNKQQNPYNNYLRVSQITHDTKSCFRKIYYEFNEVEQINNPSIQDYFRLAIGTAIHEVVQANLKDNYLTHIEERFYDHEFKLTGQIDGYIKSTNQISDIKTCNEHVFKYVCEKGALNSHIAQVSLYIKMFNEKYNTNITSAKIIYINKASSIVDLEGFTHNSECVKIVDVNFNQKLYDKVIAKVNDFWKRFEENKLPTKVSTKYICNSCPYIQTCRNVKVWE